MCWLIAGFLNHLQYFKMSRCQDLLNDHPGFYDSCHEGCVFFFDCGERAKNDGNMTSKKLEIDNLGGSDLV